MQRWPPPPSHLVCHGAGVCPAWGGGGLEAAAGSSRRCCRSALSRGSAWPSGPTCFGAVREPTFRLYQSGLRLALDRLLSPSPTSPPGIARSGFSATSQLNAPRPAQAAFPAAGRNQSAGSLGSSRSGALQGRRLPLRLPKSDLDAATAALPRAWSAVACWPPTHGPQPVLTGPGPLAGPCGADRFEIALICG